jgi:flavin reductase (DIM6/NTAB) family NADH-FMN oxidoreductase RutF/DNA-binding IclR family transcriptional regulator
MTSRLDRRDLRDVLGAFVTGVTVVTTRDRHGQPQGVTANSFSSVSLEPPLILWSQSLAAKSFPVFRDAQHFAVNILAEDQVGISNRFAQSGADKFGGLALGEGLGGVPIIQDAAAHLECSKAAMYPGGDHAVFLGKIERIHHGRRKPLVFGGGKYMVAQAYDLGGVSLDLGMSSLAHLDAARVAMGALPGIADRLRHTMSLSVWGNKGPTVIAWEPSSRPVSENLRIGLVVSVTRSATGRAFAAFLPHGLTAAANREDFAEPPADAPTPAAFDARLDEFRQHGVALAAVPPATSIHQQSVTAFSAPVFARDGTMAFALTVTARAEEAQPQWDCALPQQLREAAAALSQRLGHGPA